MSYLADPEPNVLIHDLGSNAWEVRRDAADMLGARAHPAGVQYLAPGLRDPVGAVQAACAQALGAIGGEDALQALLACLDDPNFSVPNPVLEAMGTMNLRSKRAIPYLIRYLSDESSRTRGIANTSLMVITGQSKGFKASADEATRKEAVQKWSDWWMENADSFVVVGAKLD